MDTINSKIMTKMHTLRMTGVEPVSRGATSQHFTIKLQPPPSSYARTKLNLRFDGGWIRTNDLQIMSLTR